VRSAEDGTVKCMRHGGGKRCSVAGCGKGGLGASGKCKAHGKRRGTEGLASAAGASPFGAHPPRPHLHLAPSRLRLRLPSPQGGASAAKSQAAASRRCRSAAAGSMGERGRMRC